MRKIGIVGWNGYYNVGDDAMTSVIVKYLVQSHIGNRFHFFSDTKSLAKYNSKDEPVEIKGIPLYRIFKKIPWIRSIAIHYIFPIFFASNKDILLFGGGSFIHRAKLSFLYLRIIRNIRKKNPDVLIGAVGISVGPFKNQNEEKAAKACLEQMHFIAVRDKRSYQLVKEMGLNNHIKCAPDLALLLPALHNNSFCEKGNEGNYIGLSLRYGHVRDEKIVWLSSLIQKMAEKYPFYKLKIFTFCAFVSENDMNENRRLIASLSENLHDRIIIINYSRDPFDFYEEIYSCDLMLCMRLHAAIISYAVNTKFTMISYHQKCLDFAKEVGLPAEYILKENVAVDKTLEILEQLLQQEEFIFSKPRNEIMDSVKEHFYFIPHAFAE